MIEKIKEYEFENEIKIGIKSLKALEGLLKDDENMSFYVFMLKCFQNLQIPDDQQS